MKRLFIEFKHKDWHVEVDVYVLGVVIITLLASLWLLR